MNREPITLDDEFVVAPEENHFVLMRNIMVYSKKKKKKVPKVQKWWFPKLSMALERYLNESMRPLESVKEIAQKQKEIELLIKSIQ